MLRTLRRMIAQGAIPARVLVALAAWLVFWSLGLPLYLDALAFLAIAFCAATAHLKQLALLLASLVVSTGACEVLTRTLLATHRIAREYREHEKWVIDTGSRSGYGRYVSYVNDRIEAPHGNLPALDFTAPDSIRESRVIVFKTDGLGHRNDRDYHRQELLLAGDSLVMCSGTSQEDSLVNVLKAEHGIDAYSIAHPGDPDLYVSMIGRFLREINGSVRVLLFVFEGNDFVTDSPLPTEPGPSRYDQIKVRFAKTLSPVLQTPEILFNLSRQFERRLLGSGGVVEVHAIGGKDVGFYIPYIDVACAPKLRLKIRRFPVDVRGRIEAVFLVPTKYRVYHPLLEETERGRRTVLTPSPALEALQRFFSPVGIPVIDLTPSLRARARELLPKGEYVYWRDDTHWNGAGIRTAATDVAAFVRGGQARR